MSAAVWICLGSGCCGSTFRVRVCFIFGCLVILGDCFLKFKGAVSVFQFGILDYVAV